MLEVIGAPSRERRIANAESITNTPLHNSQFLSSSVVRPPRRCRRRCSAVAPLDRPRLVLCCRRLWRERGSRRGAHAQPARAVDAHCSGRALVGARARHWPSRAHGSHPWIAASRRRAGRQRTAGVRGLGGGAWAGARHPGALFSACPACAARCCRPPRVASAAQCARFCQRLGAARRGIKARARCRVPRCCRRRGARGGGRRGFCSWRPRGARRAFLCAPPYAPPPLPRGLS